MTKTIRREAMSSVDAAWLGMDSPTNLMIINGVMLFDEPIDFEGFKAVLEKRLAGNYERFRQRIVESPPGTRRLFWEVDPHFDIRSHVRRIALPAPGDTAALQNLVSDLMSESLERDRPLWRFYLIENVGQGCAIFGRLHHCIADGVALIQVLLSLTDTSAETSLDVDVTNVPPPTKFRRSLPYLGSVLAQARKRSTQLSAVARSALSEGRQSLENPARALAMARSAGIMTAASAAILAKLLIIPPDRPSVFRNELSAVKRVAWSEPLDLERVKQIGRAAGATVNDVLIAAVTGALRRYMQRHNDNLDDGDLRAMVPVNLRASTAPLTLGNQFSLVYLSLPVGIADPYRRLFEVKRRMEMLKNSPEPLVVYQVLNLLGMAPSELARKATDWFAGKASCVLTNLPGPRQMLYFAGKPLRRIMFWVPQSGGIGLGISVISYAGAVTLGIVLDETLASDPEVMLQEFHAEFAELERLVMARANVQG
jgi:WS/DGAT/MGAT family acyltransferase